MRTLRLTLAVCLLLGLVYLSPNAEAAAGVHRTAHVFAIVNVAGDDVVAVGSVRGLTGSNVVTVALEERVGGRWRTRASSRLRRAGYVIVWKRFRSRKGRFRVVALRGHATLAESKASTPFVAARLHTTTHVTLRDSSYAPQAGNVLSVNSMESSATTVILAKDAQRPKVGSVFVSNASATSSGALGTVTSESVERDGRLQLHLRPASLQAAYSSFSAQLSGSLGQLQAGGSAAALRGRLRAHGSDSGNAGLDPFNVGFSCTDPATQQTVTHSIDLSAMQAQVDVEIPSLSNGFYGPYVMFALYGQPKLNFGVTFSGTESCEAKASLKIPIADTPLELNIGPDFTISATGSVGVNFTWDPRISFGFARGRGVESTNFDGFTNEGHTSFTGQAKITASLNIDVGLTLAGRIGITGSVGPSITGAVTASTATNQTCLDVTGEIDAALTGHADLFFNNYSFTIGQFSWPKPPFSLYHDCTGATSRGSGAIVDGVGVDGVDIGDTEAQVISILGTPDQTTTAPSGPEWVYNKLGVSTVFATATGTVIAVSAIPPNQSTTLNGIHNGSTYAQLLAAYPSAHCVQTQSPTGAGTNCAAGGSASTGAQSDTNFFFATASPAATDTVDGITVSEEFISPPA